MTSLGGKGLGRRLAARALGYGLGRLCVQALHFLSVDVSSTHVRICADRPLPLSEDRIVIERLELNELNSLIGVWMESNDGLKAIRVDAGNLAHDAHLHVLRILLRDGHIRRRVVLFITHEDVRDQRTLAWQERDGQLDCFSVPILRVPPLEFDAADCLIELVKEAELGAHAEVRDREEAELFEDELARKLDLNCGGREEVLEGQRCDLHYIPYVKRVNPLILVEVAQDVFHVGVAHLEAHAATEARVCLSLGGLRDVHRGEDRGLARVEALQTVMVFGQGPGAGHSILRLRSVVFERYLPEDRLEDGQQFDSRLLQQGKAEI